ncbi:hypothetical protein AB672_03515 [Xylella taiwanensis]|nr:hypothetical protein AB672_03515 [Xylella taiwanensis]
MAITCIGTVAFENRSRQCVFLIAFNSSISTRMTIINPTQSSKEHGQPSHDQEILPTHTNAFLQSAN